MDSFGCRIHRVFSGEDSDKEGKLDFLCLPAPISVDIRESGFLFLTADVLLLRSLMLLLDSVNFN